MFSLEFAPDAPPIEIRLGTDALVSGARDCAGRVLIRSRRVLADIARSPSLGFARAYAEGLIEVQGDLVATLCALLKSNLGQKAPPLLLRLKSGLLPNWIRRARRNAQAHYDLGNDFFSLWLDESMTYSCAVFPRPDASLCEAQRTKADLICTKLDLQPQERFLDIGCGWGYLALHAAQKYGTSSVGITLSAEQQRYATAWAERWGLAGGCQFLLQDYRHLTGAFDKIASVGMIEHVGRRHLKAFFRSVASALRPGGRCLIQSIAQRTPRHITPFTSTIFPGGHLPAVSELVGQASAAGLDCRHADNLAEHYALTLRHWRTNFQAVRAEVEKLKGRWFARWWELYLAFSEAAFRVGRLQLMQMLFTKGYAALPLDRRFATF